MNFEFGVTEAIGGIIFSVGMIFGLNNFLKALNGKSNIESKNKNGGKD